MHLHKWNLTTPSLPVRHQLSMFSLQRKSALCRFVRMRSSLSMCKIALRRFAQECMSTVCANDLCRNMCHAHCALDNTYNYLQFKISRFCSIGSRWSCSTARLVWLFNFCFNFEQPTMPSEANCFLITPSFTNIEIPRLYRAWNNHFTEISDFKTNWSQKHKNKIIDFHRSSNIYYERLQPGCTIQLFE